MTEVLARVSAGQVKQNHLESNGEGNESQENRVTQGMAWLFLFDVDLAGQGDISSGTVSFF